MDRYILQPTDKVFSAENNVLFSALKEALKKEEDAEEAFRKEYMKMTQVRRY